MDDSGGDDELVNFPQEVYEEVLKAHPALATADQEELAQAVLLVIQRTHDLTQEVVVGRVLVTLEDCWRRIRRKRPSKAVLDALKKKPAVLYREAVTAVQDQTMAAIAGVIAHDEPDAADPDDVLIGTAVGQA